MNREFFTYLPRDVIINILSRLPIRTIIHCKCVCKSWLHLVETHDFVNYHLSKSVPGLAIHQSRKSLESIKIFEFEDEPDLDYHELHYNPVTQFDLSYLGWVEGSANGLLFVCDLFVHPNGLYICNPITRDYIQLHSPQDFVYSYPQVVTYGFGVSKINGQYKVVRIFQDCMRDQSTRELLRISKFECLVYTLGSGSWRRIAPGPLLEYSRITTGTFLNGNLHWLVFDLNGFPWISCFDLETETFSTISAPLPSHGRDLVGPYALRDCICLCDYSSDDEIVIWLMKEFGVEQYWTKEFVISKIPDIAGESYATVCPIKVFKDGDILMAWDNKFLFYYSYRTNTTQKLNMLDKHICISAKPPHFKLSFAQKFCNGELRNKINFLPYKIQTFGIQVQMFARICNRLGGLDFYITHIFREGDRVADELAHRGYTMQTFQLMHSTDIPRKLQGLIRVDQLQLSSF